MLVEAQTFWTIRVFGGFWKLPLIAQSENGNLFRNLGFSHIVFTLYISCIPIHIDLHSQCKNVFKVVINQSCSKIQAGAELCQAHIKLQVDPRELIKSIGLLHRPGSIPGSIIRGGKFTDACTFWYSMVKINTNHFLNCFFFWLQFH